MITKAATVVCSIFLMIVSCSYQSPSIQQNPPVTDADVKAFAKIKPIVDKDCGRCHNGSIQPLVFDTAAKFKGSLAKTKISNNSMPPDKALDPNDKQALLAFLGG